MKRVIVCVTACCIAGMPAPTAAIAQQVKALVEAYNSSGLDIFHQLAAKPGNIAFSPYSVGSAMAMARAGARGATEAEMARVLRQHLARADADAANGELLKILNGYDKSAVPPDCALGMHWTGHRCEGPPSAKGDCRFRLWADREGELGADREGELCVANPLKGPPASAKLVAANALMLRGSIRMLSDDYQRLVRDKYAGETFAGVGVEQINGWVKQKTESRIPKMFDQAPGGDVFLLNAIYFQAQWASTFTKSLTRNEAFNLSLSQRIDVPMMRQTMDTKLVTRRGYRAIRLPYEIASLAMIIALPNEVEGVAAVTEQLDAKELSELMDGLTAAASTRVALTMPRFRMSFHVDMVQPFKQLGIALAFGGKADFSGMTGRPPAEGSLMITGIHHRAVIDVTEEGTEAAAATVVEMGETARAPDAQPKPELFRVDHPFVLLIADRTTGALLFAGRVVDPR